MAKCDLFILDSVLAIGLKGYAVKLRISLERVTTPDHKVQNPAPLQIGKISV